MVSGTGSAPVELCCAELNEALSVAAVVLSDSEALSATSDIRMA